jgi:hypothetical protein
VDWKNALFWFATGFQQGGEGSGELAAEPAFGAAEEF